MGAIGGLLGLNGGAGGTGFAGPQLAPLQTPAREWQAANSYDQNQIALNQQQNLLAALQGVNGIGNQQAALQSLQGLAAQQQGTAQQYQNLANGIGPNPAQAQLAQNTAANVAQQGALMAGQRGASQNVGLMARQIAQQGAATQQQAVGQAATLQAQQQIAGLQGLAGQQAAIGNTIGQQAGIAGAQVGQQVGQVNANTAAQQAEQANLLNAIAAQNSANVANYGNMNTANASMANTRMQGQHGLIGGVLSGIGSVLGLAHGGNVPHMATGGPVSMFGKFLKGAVRGAEPAAAATGMDYGDQGANKLAQGMGNFMQGLGSRIHQPGAGQNEGTGVGAALGFNPTAAHGGLVDVVVSPGEKIFSPGQAKQVARGGKVSGKTVPGKAEVKGDSLKNDKVPAKLPAGTIIVPRTKAHNPRAFVQATLAKRGKR